MTEIYLIRHGITAANLNKIFAGRSQEPLHADGITQIESVGRQLVPKNIRSIVSGPLPRTTQTAGILSRITGAGIVIDQRLNEILIPHWDGCTKDELRERFGNEYPHWLSQPEKFELPDCETLYAVQQRAVEAAEQIFQINTRQNTLIVSHLIPLRCLLLHYRDLPMKDFRSISFDNGAVIRLSREKDGQTTVDTIHPPAEHT
ncbi:MAG: histidine phosphatase family protein [Proteobacteria bacterium]|nr:histidine phosphatase family protein [Pseudomonadota bacterium]MBU1709734.1 histidine phosphatase family protein [Pseudomonadota bacterium]